MKHEMLFKRLFPYWQEGYISLLSFFLFSFISISLLMIYNTAYAGGKHHGPGDHHKNKEMNKMHWMAPEVAALRPNPVKCTVESVKRGETLFLKNCAVCHGSDAAGSGPAAKWLNPRPANLRKMSGMHRDGDFEWKIANGRGKMPSWKDILTESERWDLVNYIQSLSVSTKISGHHHVEHNNEDMAGESDDDRNSVHQH